MAGRQTGRHRRPPEEQATYREVFAVGEFRALWLAQALSLIFGVEVLVVLKDMWGLDGAGTLSVAQWAARALVQAAIAESEEGGEGSGLVGVVG